MRQSGIEKQLEIYKRDPLYRFTEGEARELADEVLRLRAREKVLRELAERRGQGWVEDALDRLEADRA